MQDKLATVSKMDLDFPKVKSSQDMMDTLNKVTSIFKEVASAWKECPDVKGSKVEPIKKVSSILEIFSNPSTYDLYNIALGALDNW